MVIYLLLVATLCGVLVQPTQAAKQKKTELKEITIYISEKHKAVILALLEAVDRGKTVTGIAELDSLASTHGLIGIYRKNKIFPYSYRFRLTFPPGADLATIAEAYRYLPYIQSERIGYKLIAGTLGGGVGALTGGLIGFGVGSAIEEDCSAGESLCGLGGLFGGLLGGCIGYPIGTAIGVSRVDPRDRFIMSLAGSVVGFIGGVWLTVASEGIFFPSLFIGPVVGATMLSELWRQSPTARRVSVGLVPDPRGRLSAVATLRF